MKRDKCASILPPNGRHSLRKGLAGRDYSESSFPCCYSSLCTSSCPVQTLSQTRQYFDYIIWLRPLQQTNKKLSSCDSRYTTKNLFFPIKPCKTHKPRDYVTSGRSWSQTRKRCQYGINHVGMSVISILSLLSYSFIMLLSFIMSVDCHDPQGRWNGVKFVSRYCVHPPQFFLRLIFSELLWWTRESAG